MFWVNGQITLLNILIFVFTVLCFITTVNASNSISCWVVLSQNVIKCISKPWFSIKQSFINWPYKPNMSYIWNKWWVITRSSQFQVCILWRTHDNFHNDLSNQKFHRSFWMMGSLKLVRLRQTVRVGACSTTGTKIIIENDCFTDSTCICILRVQVPVPDFSGQTCLPQTRPKP